LILRTTSPWSYLFQFVVVLLLVTAACGEAPSTLGLRTEGLGDVPQPVLQAAGQIATAARVGDPTGVAELAHSGFEFDFSRPDTTLLEHLTAGATSGLLDRLELVLTFTPGRRLSPYGNGAVQELWVYPALALDPPADWSKVVVDDAIERGLFSSTELDEYLREGAYLGFSVGLTPEGDWTFFTSGQVSHTQR
jgi:hypothetical protein|tara:strand:+ start:13880 stop:14458 length:579 start_codon:yes stop_codon:yes gene_type:complete